MPRNKDEVKVTVKLFNKEFNEGMKEMRDESGKLKREFQLQEQQMKNTANESEKLRAKVEYLGKQHELAGKKVQETERQYEAVKTQFGENSKAAEDMAKKLNYAQIEEQKLANEIYTTNKALDAQSREADQAASKLEKVGNKLQSAGEKMTSAGTTMSGFVTAPLVAGLGLVTKGTEELRGDLARLETNAYSAGFGMEFMREQLGKVNEITPDVNANVEGLSNLMATPLSEEGLAKAVDYLSGAAIQFSETLKFEGLADGLQETLATGKAIGPFAELLERSGIVLEDFDEGLQAAVKSGQEENYVLQTLADTGLGAVNDEFRANNKELVESRRSSLEFQQAMAKLGETLTPVVTAITNAVTKLMEKFNGLSPMMQKISLIVAGVLAAIGPILVIAGTVVSAIGSITLAIAEAGGIAGIAGGFIAKLSSFIAFLTGPIGIAIAAITALIAIFIALYKNNEDFRNKVLVIWEGIKAAFQTALSFIMGIVQSVMTSVTEFFRSQLEVIRQFWDENGAQIIELVKMAFENVWAIIQGVMGFIKGYFQAVWPVISNIVKVAWTVIQGAIKNALAVIMGVIQFFLKIFQGDWQGAFNVIKDTVSNIMRNIVSTFKSINLLQIGKDIINGLVRGISSMGGAVKNMVSKLASNIPSWAKKVLGIKSPSRVMIEVGEDTGEGAVIGVERKVKEAKRIAAELAQSFIPEKTNKLAAVTAGIGRTINAVIPEVQIASIQAAFKQRQFPSHITVISELDGYEVARNQINYLDPMFGDRAGTEFYMKGERK